MRYFIDLNRKYYRWNKEIGVQVYLDNIWKTPPILFNTCEMTIETLRKYPEFYIELDDVLLRKELV